MRSNENLLRDGEQKEIKNTFSSNEEYDYVLVNSNTELQAGVWKENFCHFKAISEEDLKSYRKSTFKLSSCGAAARPEPSEKPINTTTNSLEASTRPFK